MLSSRALLRAKQVGFTLIELMIALVLATLVIAASMGFLFSSVKSSTENVNTILLNQQLRSVLSFIHDEVRRSGFSVDPTDTSHMDLLNWNDATDCLTYGYQTVAASGATSTMSFRLDNSSIRYTTPGNAACTGGIAINDSDSVQITNFAVTPANLSASAAHPTLGGTSIIRMTITLTGQINNPPISRTLSEVIRVRNESP